MPCRQTESGKWAWGSGPGRYDSREACERANAGRQEFELSADFTLCPPADLQQYFGDWMIHEESFFQHLHTLQNMDLTAHFRLAQQQRERQQEGLTARGEGKPYVMIREGIALVQIDGPMTKRTQSMGPLGTVEIRRQMRLANADPEVQGILLKIESPGGTMAGTADLANDVHAITANKPVLTYFEDMGTSAAYFVGSQATVVRANESGIIGSIGTMLVVLDISEAANQAGIKVNVIKTGEFKAVGAPGTEVTKEQLDYLQERVNRGNDLFIRAVQRGRPNMSESQVRQVADGKVHLAAQAAELGMIDGVATLDAAVDELVSLSSPRKAVSMSETTAAAPTAATIQELKAAFPGADDAFFVAQLTAGATIGQATQAYTALLETRLKEAETKNAEALQKAQEAEAKAAEAEQRAATAATSVGNAPDDEESQSDGDVMTFSNPVEKYREEIKALELNLIEERKMKFMRAGMEEHVADIRARQDARKDAAVRVDQAFPGLRDAYMKAIIPQRNPEVMPATASVE